MSKVIYEAIRSRDWMYLQSADKPMAIIDALMDNFQFYGIENIHKSVLGGDRLTVLETEVDWISAEKGEIDRVFTTICTHPSFPANSMRAEVLIPAFRLRYYTSGPSGVHGDKGLIDGLPPDFDFSVSEGGGRFLVIEG